MPTVDLSTTKFSRSSQCVAFSKFLAGVTKLLSLLRYNDAECWGGLFANKQPDAELTRIIKLFDIGIKASNAVGKEAVKFMK